MSDEKPPGKPATWIDGRDLDGKGNATLVDGQALERVVDKGARREEARVTVDGVELRPGLVMTIRVALASFAIDLEDPEYRADLGPIGEMYAHAVDELQAMLTEKP